MSNEVDLFLSHAKKWRKELTKLRTILLDCHLTEELKWGKPCYTFQQSNLVILYGLKESCAIGFLKGALLKDDRGILVKPGENSQSARWIKFTEVGQIVELESLLKAYVQEAIKAEKAGLKVHFQKNPKLNLPAEFKHKLEEMPGLKNAFQALTPGRQRAYQLYFTGAKQAKTRESRVEKCLPRILKGKGLNDCICGSSKKPPYCDGSHK